MRAKRWMAGAVLVFSLLGAAEGAGLLRPPETAPPAPEVQSPVPGAGTVAAALPNLV